MTGGAGANLRQSGLTTDAASATLRMHINDDRRFVCPRCGECNRARTFTPPRGQVRTNRGHQEGPDGRCRPRLDAFGR